MSKYDPEYLIETRRSPHAIAALVAAVLSFGLHLAALFWLSSRDFSWNSSLLSRVMPESVRRMFLVDVVAGETQPRERGSGANGALAGAFGTPAELAASADELGLSPDMVAIEPSAVAAAVLVGESGNTIEPATFPEGEAWHPRQEIVKIERRIAADEVPELERKVIPDVARVPRAPDSLPRADADGSSAPPPPGMVDIATLIPKEDGVGIGLPSRDGAPGQSALRSDAPLVVAEPRGRSGGALFEEVPGEVTDARPIENLLKAKATVFTDSRDEKYGYVRIEISRAGPEVLPPIPKDVILVQDSSNSMTEQRLYFCRAGLLRCLTQIGPQDRFNVVGFQDRATFCFPTWQENTPAAMAKAEQFIGGLTSGGNTDIMASLRPLMELERKPGRPVIAFVVTDGRSTSGLTSSSGIIGRFTKGNEGGISVYTMGTLSSANAYLLDLLSYCNRGETTIVTKGRWDIPEAMERAMHEVSRPVLSDVRFRLADPGVFEVYPALTSNLYLDRSLVLHGRFPKSHKQLVIQVVGQAGQTKCDMIFDLALTGGDKGDKGIRETWAEQKLYHLMGRYARQPSAELVAEMRQTAREYHVSVPYEASLEL